MCDLNLIKGAFIMSIEVAREITKDESRELIKIWHSLDVADGGLYEAEDMLNHMSREVLVNEADPHSVLGKLGRIDVSLITSLKSSVEELLVANGYTVYDQI